MASSCLPEKTLKVDHSLALTCLAVGVQHCVDISHHYHPTAHVQETGRIGQSLIVGVLPRGEAGETSYSNGRLMFSVGSSSTCRGGGIPSSKSDKGQSNSSG